MIRKHQLEKSKKHFIEAFADLIFFAWILVTFFFERDTVGRVALVVFCGIVLLFMIAKGTISDNLKSKLTAANGFFLSYFLFVAYNYWQVKYTGYTLNYGLADKMLETISLNAVFIYCVYRYCVLKGKMEEVLNIYVFANIITLAITVIGSGRQLLSGRLGSELELNANVIALSMINCMMIIMHRNAEKRSTLNIIMMFVCIGAIFLTGSRKGLIGLTIGIVLYQLMSKGLKKYKNLIIAAVVVAFAYYLIMNIELLYNIAGYRLEALLSYFKGESYNEASLASRNDVAVIGWRYVQKNPWFGYGLNCFGIVRGAYGLYSHNNYLELMFGCGIIGTAFYYLGYLYVLFGHLKLYFKHKVMDSKPYIILLLIQMFLEYAYVSYFGRRYLLFIIISLSALQLAKAKIQSEVNNNEQIKEGSQESL